MNRRPQGRTALTWLVRAVVVAGVAAVWFFPPLPQDATNDETATVSSYDAQMELSKEGDLRTTETIGVEMPNGKRGIFRIFDTADPRRSNVEHPVDVEAVERGGIDEPYQRVDSARGTDSIRIGSPSVYLDPGAHTYRIVSSTGDVFEPGDEGETWWWWDVVGSGWQMPMAQTSVVATLPAEPLRAECVTGDDDPCTVTVEGTAMRVSTGALAPFTPVTVRVAFDADDVAAPIAPAVNRDLLFSLLAALIGAGAAFALWRRTKERAPGFPVLFEPPFMVPPALGVRVLDEKDSDESLQATLFDLAERGVLRLRGDDDTWHIEVVQPLEAEHLHPIEQTLLGSLDLTGPGSTFTVSSSESSGRIVASTRKALHAQTSASSAEYLRSSPAGMVAVAVGWICLAASVFMIGRYFVDSGWVRWPLLAATTAFALVAAGMMFSAGTATIRTSEGRDLWSRSGGFARFLTTDSSEARFDASAHLDWYPRYLAWAVALGVADEWAARYEAQGVELPEVPWVIWTGSGQRFSTASMTRSFDHAIASASAAYAASQAAKASSGGGGFSGGSGGGGGGGGSW